MGQAVQEKAQALLAEADQITNALLPATREEIVDADKVTPEEQAEIDRLVGELDMDNTQSIITFGSAAQTELQAISSSMLDGVRNKDVGPAGNSLRDIVSTIRGFSVDELDPNRKPSFFERIFGRAGKAASDFIAKYEDVLA